MADHIERAKTAFIHREFDNAIKEYAKAIQELPEDQHFVAYSNRGAALMNTGNVKEAIKCFRRALELNPEHYESMHNMGVAFAAIKEFERALECFEKTLDYAPYFYASHCGKSEALASLNRFEEAADAARDGIQEDPNEPIAHADLGFAYLKLGRFEESVNAYDRAQVLKDRSPETTRLHAIALAEYALSVDKEGDSGQALELYLQSITKHETPLALHNLGILYVRHSQPSKAKTAFGKALNLDPDYFPTNAALGVLHAKERLNDLALPFLIKAYELNPHHMENLYNLGLVYMKEGNHEEAANAFRALLKIDSSNQDAKLALQLLKSAHGGSSRGGSDQQGSWSSGGGAAEVDYSSGAPPGTVSRRPPRRSSSMHTGSRGRQTRSSSSHATKRGHSVSAKKKRAASRAPRIRKFYSVEELQANPLPPDVDKSQKELYLVDQEFIELFGMKKEEFLELPYWKQTLEKKRYNLF